MARITQFLLPLVAVALAEAQLPNIPFFDNIPGLHHPSPGSRDNRITHKNIGYNGGYGTWFQHFGNPDVHQFSSESHERDNSYENYDPFFNPYFHGNGWDHMPGINNVFNIPNPGYNSHRHQQPHRGSNPQENPKQDHKEEPNAEKPEEKPKEILPVDTKPDQDKDPKLNEANISDSNNKINEANIPDVENKLHEPKIPTPINSDELLPPKTNAIKKEDDIGEGDKSDKQVDLDEKKDYLLVGQGNNGNNVYLLHENNPNPTTVITPNGNQPGNNIIYVPYNPGQSNNQVYQVDPGQSNNQVYQVVNSQPTPSNMQVTPDKLGVSNGFNSAISNPGQSTTNLNAGTQNPGYVTIYSNGQLIQIPGVVVNSAPNNVPVQSDNQVQGTNYIIANAVPNNVQTAPAIQNPGTNVIYATIPNQASNGPIYFQVPSCVNTMSNGCGSSAIVQNQGVNNGVPSNVIVYQAYPNTVAQPAVSNGYIQPNMVANQGQGAITVAIPNNQNVQYQPAVQLSVSSGSNVYGQPIVSNLGQGQNVPNQEEKQEVSYQPTINNNQPTYQPAVQMPVNSGTNWYNQPTISNQPQGQNQPIQGTMVNNQNTPEQSGVVISIPSGYDHPLITNPIMNVEPRADMSSNQNGAQLAVLVNGDSNDQAIVNNPSNAEVINHESDISQPSATSSLVLDSDNLSALGAQPAIMIADFKDKSDDKSSSKKDKKKSKDKKEKKDKGKKKDKKPKDDDKTKDSEPFTNKEI